LDQLGHPSCVMPEAKNLESLLMCFRISQFLFLFLFEFGLFVS